MRVDSEDAATLARDWIGQFILWGRADRRRRGDAIDWQQVAMDGLVDAIRGWDPGDGRDTFSIAYARRCYTGARSATVRTAGREGRRGTIPLAEGSDDELPCVGIPGPGDDLELADECRWVLARLTPDQRLTACALADGLGRPTIAAANGLTRQAVDETIRRARKRAAIEE